LDKWQVRTDHLSWSARQIRQSMISRLNAAMTANLPLMRVLVPLSPLLGLIGTVSGMLEVFDSMALRGSADARTMASGVSHAVFIKELGLMVNRPSGADPTQASGGNSVPVHVLANGEIWIDNRVIDLRAVRANVERIFATNPKSGVLIIADKDAETGLVVQVV